MLHLRRTAVRALAACALALAGSHALASPAVADETRPATSATQMYTTTGVWSLNGRTWKTNCSMYSSSVERCRTEIWATAVVYSGGRFTQSNGWVFNNLTYKESPRAGWEELNPLITPGEHTISGRRWRTECNTSWTGQNACRSRIWATTTGLRDGRFQNWDAWVFNNIVNLVPVPCQVSEQQLADVRKEPVVIIDCLQSSRTPAWLGLRYPATVGGKVVEQVAFFQKKSGGWALQTTGGRDSDAICSYFRENLPAATDLADMVPACFAG